MAATQQLGRTKADKAVPYDFEKANREYVAEGRHPKHDDLSRGPRTYTAIITCIDSRATPEHYFQLKPNEVWSIRNGGGRTNDPSVLRSLLILQALSEVKEVKVLHHKNCGSLYYSNQWVHDLVENNDDGASGQFVGPAAFPHGQTVATFPFTKHGNEVDEKEIIVNSIIQDVEFLRNHPLVKPTVKVTGWYQDLGDGSVYEVEV